MIFVKQYGKQRTGTNYFRNLVHKNSREAAVLMNALGDKHKPQEDYHDWIRRYRAQIKHKGKIHIDIGLNGKRIALEPDDLLKAVEDDRLRFLITIKNPFSFIPSHIKYRNNVHRSRINSKAARKNFIRKEVVNWNQNYCAWAKLLSHPRCFVAQHEYAIANATALVKAMLNKLELKQANSLGDVSGVVRASYDRNTRIDRGKFNVRYYRTNAYMSQLSSDEIKMIIEGIDWNLMDRYGYNVNTRYGTKLPGEVKYG